MALGDIVKRQFMQRIHEDGRLRSGTTFFTDICYTEEQLIDYCDMVADALIHYGKAHDEAAPSESMTDDYHRRHVHELFRDKFEVLENSED